MLVDVYCQFNLSWYCDILLFVLWQNTYLESSKIVILRIQYSNKIVSFLKFYFMYWLCFKIMLLRLSLNLDIRMPNLTTFMLILSISLSFINKPINCYYLHVTLDINRKHCNISSTLIYIAIWAFRLTILKERAYLLHRLRLPYELFIVALLLLTTQYLIII